MSSNIDANNITMWKGSESIKGWMMLCVTATFVTLYAAALVGWLRPLSDVTLIARLEPIIFVILGYHFGRLPAQQSEKTFRDEIGRQTMKSEAAQHAREQSVVECEALEEKIKNARVALRPEIYENGGVPLPNGNVRKLHPTPGPEGAMRRSLETARRILDS